MMHMKQWCRMTCQIKREGGIKMTGNDRLHYAKKLDATAWYCLSKLAGWSYPISLNDKLKLLKHLDREKS